MTNINDENFPNETYKKRRGKAIYPTCIRNEKQFQGQLNVLVSFNKRDKPWQWMPLKSLKYGQQLLRNFRTYKAKQKRKHENSNLKPNEMNNAGKIMIWENEMGIVVQNNDEIKCDNKKDNVKGLDKNFYSNNNELKYDDIENIDKDFWSESDKMIEDNERSMTDIASNECLFLDFVLPLYKNILKLAEKGSNNMNAITSLCGGGKIDCCQDQRKLDGDYNKSKYNHNYNGERNVNYVHAEGNNAWNNFNVNFEHETYDAHNSNNQPQDDNPGSQNNRNSFDQELSTEHIQNFENINNEFYFPKYREIDHYNEINDKSHLNENYIELQQQDYTTQWYAKNSNQRFITYADVIEEKSSNEESLDKMVISFDDTDDSPTTQTNYVNMEIDQII